MSVNYRISPRVEFAKLAEKLAAEGIVRAETTEPTSDNFFPITDGENYCWCDLVDGELAEVVKFNTNDPTAILKAICEAGECEAISENSDRYWPVGDSFSMMLECMENDGAPVAQQPDGSFVIGEATIADIQEVSDESASFAIRRHGKEYRATVFKKNGELTFSLPDGPRHESILTLLGTC